MAAKMLYFDTKSAITKRCEQADINALNAATCTDTRRVQAVSKYVTEKPDIST